MKELYTRRDYLAQYRTYLANERTFLAYLRTALAFLISGAFLIKFSPSIHLTVLALVLVLFGILLFVYGITTCLKSKMKINQK